MQFPTMSLPPDQPPPASPPTKPKLSAEEHRARQADWLSSVRLRMVIGWELDERGITDPAVISEVLDMPVNEVTKLLRRRQWHKGDVARLEAAAARLRVKAPGS